MKIFFRKLLIVILELAIIGGILFLVAQKKGITNVSQIFPAVQENLQEKLAVSFPALEAPTEKNFLWQFKGKKYTLKMTLYQSVYDYYHSLPKQYSYLGVLPENWEEQYYGMFLASNEADNFIKDLSQNLQNIGKQHKLSDDQTVEMVMAFVQTIIYDDSKATKILAGNDNVSMQYPYETLFVQKGVCSDKSLLAYSILKEMGYGVALFAFEQDNHMALGIQCPDGYSNYNNGYCYAETTSTGNKIGIIPSFDSSTNKTVDVGQLANLDPATGQQINLGKLGQVTVLQKFQGKQYSGIIATKSMESEIAQLNVNISSLMKKIRSQKADLSSAENNLNSLKNELDELRSAGKIDQFNDNVSKYNSLLKNYKKDVKNFNNNVSLYNKDVARYNELIKQ